jgi:undecaprenyl-diphosphatase
MNATQRWSVCALVAFGFFIALGALVAGRPAIGPDLEAAALWFGRWTEAAWWLTLSGYWPVLGAIGLLALGATVVLRRGVAEVVVMLVAQSCSQAAAAGFKLLFARPRPLHWLMHYESGLSYPSGHAVTAVVFYGGLAAIAAHSPLPLGLRRIIVVAFAGWGIGIAWSRVALGAHYLTDVVGGLLFGTVWFCLVHAIERALAARKAGAAPGPGVT